MPTENLALASAFDDLAASSARHADNIAAAAHRDGIDPSTFDTWVQALRDQGERARQMSATIRDEQSDD